MDNYLQSLFSLQGRTAMVTGASRGLGKAIAIALASAGADVIGVARDEQHLVSTKEDVEALGRRFRGLACDQSDPESVERLIGTVVNDDQSPDILVNNAGTIYRAPASEYSNDDWRRVMQTNLDSVFMLCRDIGKHMLANDGGSIINIASLLSFFGGITVPAYTASKGGVALLTKALANEWSDSGVRVNAIAPGYFETDNTEALRNDENRYQEILSRIPMGRWGRADDLAGAAVYLASPASGYVTGQIVLVDGGYSAR